MKMSHCCDILSVKIFVKIEIFLKAFFGVGPHGRAEIMCTVVTFAS